MSSTARLQGATIVLSTMLACAVRAQEPAQPAPAQTTQPDHRRTVYSRSGDQQPAAAAQTQEKPDDVTATDEERSAVLITSFDFDVRLLPLENALNMRARITVKNDAAHPLGKLPLQISSSLDWVEVRRATAEGSPEIFPLHVRTLDSDIDHTGKVHETVVVLRQPLAAGASVSLELLYSGTVTLNATRLERIGTPHDAAVHTDWDRIDSDFISLTGFGSTLWHPAAAPPVLLGDGAKLFHAIG
ncbi:MAG TPA: hypothetical protein VNX22_02385, partial [Acidobacteriaceae bacterium]|nr:hypothetical protein [Acidobacteriaceae bacterium]